MMGLTVPRDPDGAGQEACVEHLVRFIKNQDAHVAEVHQTAIQKLNQTAWCCHQDIKSAADVPFGDVKVGSAHHTSHAKTRGVSEGLEHSSDLLTELTRGNQNHRARVAVGLNLRARVF